MKYQPAVIVFEMLAGGVRPSSDQFVAAVSSLSAAAIEQASGDFSMAYKVLKSLVRNVVKLSSVDRVRCAYYAQVLAV